MRLRHDAVRLLHVWVSRGWEAIDGGDVSARRAGKGRLHDHRTLQRATRHDREWAGDRGARDGATNGRQRGRGRGARAARRRRGWRNSVARTAATLGDY